MKISDLKKMWEEDSRIDVAHLVDEAANVPKLHSKYLGYLMHYRRQLMIEEFSSIMFRKDKYKWYRGTISEERLKELGWSPLLENHEKTNAGAERRMLDDEDLVKMARKREYLKIMISSLETIMKSISTRGWDIKNAIQMYLFEHGEK